MNTILATIHCREFFFFFLTYRITVKFTVTQHCREHSDKVSKGCTHLNVLVELNFGSQRSF